MKGVYWFAAAGIVGLLLFAGEPLRSTNAGESDDKASKARKAEPSTPKSEKADDAAAEKKEAARHFEREIAPLLAEHCIECHDSALKEGGLDLSKKAAAFEGGDTGKVIVPGKPTESLLWEYVDFDLMPKERPPLSDEKKQLLRTWIETGATWSLEMINPADYTHGGEVTENWLRRLTVIEYIETVRSTLGVDIGEEARRMLPKDLRADGFSNTAYNLNVDLGHVEAYAELAALIVERMDVGEFASQYTDRRRLKEKPMRKLISRMGRWVLRGPLEAHEVEAFLAVAQAVKSAGGDFEEATGYVLEAMLQSPRFIYRVEKQRGDGTPQPVGPYELASRMSYTIWGGPPDEELMEAAEDGDLSDPRDIEAQVQRMLEDPRAVARSRQFIDEWLHLARLENLRPDPERFPEWSDELAQDMREETLAYFEDVAWKQKRPLTDLMNAQVTFATPRLAEFYDLEPKDDKGLSRYDLSSVPPRGGLLTQGSILTVGGDEASTVTRGLFVLHDILGGTVSDPPPGVDTTPVPTEPGLSMREIAEQRIANPSCGGCHKKFEPLSFGMSKFDGLGAYHEVDEHGNNLRDDGEILFPGSEEPVSYENSSELMSLLAESEQVSKTMTRKVTQFALGRPLAAADAPAVQEIHARAQQGGGTYASLITAIVLSDLVQMTRTETSGTEEAHADESQPEQGGSGKSKGKN